MHTNFRLFSCGFFASLITLACFLIMSQMTQQPKALKTITIKDTEFTFFKEVEKPQNTPPPKSIEVKREKVTQPPAVPKLTIMVDQTRPSIEIPNGLAKARPEMMDSIDGVEKVGPGSLEKILQHDHGLMPIIRIEPIYPVKAIIAKKEGWVKVRFNINEFGKVTTAKVIESQPRSMFNQATLNAVYRSQFKPVMINGKATPTVAEQIIYFNLPKSASQSR